MFSSAPSQPGFVTAFCKNILNGRGNFPVCFADGSHESTFGVNKNEKDISVALGK
jgi:hypothetical protein